MRTPESYEKQEVDAFLDSLHPAMCWKFKPYMAGFGKGGVPDYCVCLLGKFWVLEIKRPGRHPTPIQDRRMKEVELAGGHTAWGTAEEVIVELKLWLKIKGFDV